MFLPSEGTQHTKPQRDRILHETCTHNTLPGRNKVRRQTTLNFSEKTSPHSRRQSTVVHRTSRLPAFFVFFVQPGIVLAVSPAKMHPSMVIIIPETSCRRKIVSRTYLRGEICTSAAAVAAAFTSASALQSLFSRWKK